jgi:tetratricopeptide (TPR) repeat protein
LASPQAFSDSWTKPRRAFTKALALRRALGDVRGEGATLTELGWIYRLKALEGGGNEARERARMLLQEALARRRVTGDVVGEAGTLDRLGTVHRDAGRWQEALSCYERSLALLSRSPPGCDRAHTLNNVAEVWLDRGDPAAARRFASSALAQFNVLAARDPHGEAHAHYLLGRAAAGLGDARSARRELEQALSFMEELRAGLQDQTLTLPFFALRQLYFEGAIEALMDLDATYPREGFAAAALATSERRPDAHSARQPRRAAEPGPGHQKAGGGQAEQEDHRPNRAKLEPVATL